MCRRVSAGASICCLLPVAPDAYLGPLLHGGTSTSISVYIHVDREL